MITTCLMIPAGPSGPGVGVGVPAGVGVAPTGVGVALGVGVGVAVGVAPLVEFTTGTAAETLDPPPPPLQPQKTARAANAIKQHTRGMEYLLGWSRTVPVVHLRVPLDHCAQRALTEI
jgi:hypothetical protein